MRAYADSSFLVKLVTHEPDSERAVAEFRRLGLPSLFYLPLHALEVTNAIRQRVCQSRRGRGEGRCSVPPRDRDVALARIGRWLERGWLIEVSLDMEAGFALAQTLSERHTERLGCRGFDLLHVAFAMGLECDAFLTADRVQAALARSEGLGVTVVSRHSTH